MEQTIENKYLFDTNLEPSEYDVIVNTIPEKKSGIILDAGLKKSLQKDEILPYVILAVGSEVHNYKKGDFVYVSGSITGYPHLLGVGKEIGQFHSSLILSKIVDSTEYIKLYNSRIDNLVAEQQAIDERVEPSILKETWKSDEERRNYYKDGSWKNKKP